MPNKSRALRNRQPAGPRILGAPTVQQTTGLGPKAQKAARQGKTRSTAEKPQDSPPGARGRRGAVTGRKARAQKLSAQRRREIARRAARARWS